MLYSDLCNIVQSTNEPYILSCGNSDASTFTYYKVYGCTYNGYNVILMFTPSEYQRAVIPNMDIPESEPLNEIVKGTDSAYYVTVRCSYGDHMHRLRMAQSVFQKRISYRINKIETALLANDPNITLLGCLTKVDDKTICCKRMDIPETEYRYYTGCDTLDHFFMAICDEKLELISSRNISSVKEYRARTKLFKKLKGRAKQYEGAFLYETLVGIVSLF